MQLIYYLFSGGTGFVVNMGVFALGVYVFDLWYITAAIIGFICGVMVSFILQKYVTFKNTRTDTMRYQMTVYAALALFNVGMNALILYGLVDMLAVHEFVAEFISNGTVAIWSFFIYKYVTFKDLVPNPSLIYGTEKIVSESN
jgi:putative flippase GtrA